MKNLQFIFNLFAGLIITTLGAMLSLIDPIGNSLSLIGVTLIVVSLITRTQPSNNVIANDKTTHSDAANNAAIKGQIQCN